MNFFDLMALKAKADNLTIDSPVEDLVHVFKIFGVDDKDLISQVMAAAKAVTNDPTQSILSFIEDGSLIRLIAGEKTPPPECELMQCPHCNEIIVL